jgi:hypothetical protein
MGEKIEIRRFGYTHKSTRLRWRGMRRRASRFSDWNESGWVGCLQVQVQRYVMVVLYESLVLMGG